MALVGFSVLTVVLSEREREREEREEREERGKIEEREERERKKREKRYHCHPICQDGKNRLHVDVEQTVRRLPKNSGNTQNLGREKTSSARTWQADPSVGPEKIIRWRGSPHSDIFSFEERSSLCLL